MCATAHNIAQNRPDNFPSYPSDNHHCSDDVNLREGGKRYRTHNVKKSILLLKPEVSVTVMQGVSVVGVAGWPVILKGWSAGR